MSRQMHVLRQWLKDENFRIMFRDWLEDEYKQTKDRSVYLYGRDLVKQMEEATG